MVVLADISADISRVYDVYEQPYDFVHIMHRNGHSFLNPFRELAFAWLDRQLKPDKSL